MALVDGNVIGYVANNVELRTSNNGKTVTSLGVGRRRVGGSDESDFFYFDVWEKQAELCEKHCPKGTMVNVQYRLYTKKETVVGGDGKQREITTYRMTAVAIDFLARPKGAETHSSEKPAARATSRSAPAREPEQPPYEDVDTSLPFDL